MTTRGRATHRGRGSARLRGPRGRAHLRDEETDVDETLGLETNSVDGVHRDDIQVEETPMGENYDSIDTAEEGASSHVRRRGPNHGTQVPTNADNRITITIIDSKFIEAEVTRNITNDIKGIFTEAYPRWLKVPEATKNLLWENFKLRYRWDNLTDASVRKIWNENAGARLRELLYKAKKKALDNAEEQLGRKPSNLDMLGRAPTWMGTHIWDELVQKYWATEEYAQKCEKAKQNRMTEKDGCVTKHTCGSIPREAHRLKMEKTLKRNVDDFELFERCHISQGTGEFVDKKSKKVSEEYRAKQGPSDSTSLPSFDFLSWCEVTGGPSKGRLYGVGQCKTSGSYSVSSNSSVAGQGESREVIVGLTQEIEDVRESQRRNNEENKKLIENVFDEVRKRDAIIEMKNDVIKRMKEEMKVSMEEMLRKFVQDVGYPNHKFPGGSGSCNEQRGSNGGS